MRDFRNQLNNTNSSNDLEQRVLLAAAAANPTDAIEMQNSVDTATAGNGSVTEASIVNEAATPKERISGDVAFSRAFAARGIDTSKFDEATKQIVRDGSKAIDAINVEGVQNIDDVKAATSNNNRFKISGQDNLRAADGTRLLGVATSDGAIRLDKSLNDDPTGLRSAAFEEIGDRTFQDVASSQKNAGFNVATANTNGTSQGDFGNEFARQANGIQGPVDLSQAKNDTVTTLDGKTAEAAEPDDSIALLERRVQNFEAELELTDNRILVLNFRRQNLEVATADPPFFQIGVTPSQAVANQFQFNRDLRELNQVRARAQARQERRAELLDLLVETTEELEQEQRNRVPPAPPNSPIVPPIDFNPPPRFPGQGLPGGGSGFSDRRIKTDIRQIGYVKELDIELYSWRYKNDDPMRYAGVMAQDLLARPDLTHAVVVAQDGEFAGFYSVDYGAMGLQMTTEADWNARGLDSIVVSQPYALLPG